MLFDIKLGIDGTMRDSSNHSEKEEFIGNLIDQTEDRIKRSILELMKKQVNWMRTEEFNVLRKQISAKVEIPYRKGNPQK